VTAPIEPIAAVAAEPVQPPAPRLDGQISAGSFADLLAGGVDQVDRKLIESDAAARAFALDDNVPLHQVTFALEEARLSFELMLQVRARLVEGYQEIMRMQL